MKKLSLFLTMIILSGCNTIPIMDMVNTAKCITEVATKESKLTCEFEGKKILAKK